MEKTQELQKKLEKSYLGHYPQCRPSHCEILPSSDKLVLDAPAKQVI